MDFPSLDPITPDLVRQAAAMRVQVEASLSSPAAALLPAPARKAIRELAHLVANLAVEVERCKAGTQ